MNFEQSLASLNLLIEKLESGDLPLEESLKYFEEGVKLSRQCQAALKETEQKVQILMEKNGEFQTHPFLTENEV